MNRLKARIMFRYFSFTLLILMFLLAFLDGYSQKKVEFETAVVEDSVPIVSRDFVKKLFPDEKVNWFFEKNEADSSFEAKLKANKRRYSIEFSFNGVFKDAEVLIALKEVPKYVIDTIRGKLNESFSKVEFKKIQRQYISQGDVMKIVNEKRFNDVKKEVEVNYEIIIFGESTDKQAYYEYLFDGEGMFIKAQELEDSNHDNFFY
ncbi:MAG: hypothetical protein RJQ00_06695 [Vicingaceae bacterium]